MVALAAASFAVLAVSYGLALHRAHPGAIVNTADCAVTAEPAARAASGGFAGQRPGVDRAPNGVGELSDAVRDVGHCPHCRQPIAVVTRLLTPTAAHVTVPDPPDPQAGRSAGCGRGRWPSSAHPARSVAVGRAGRSVAASRLARRS